MPHGTVPMVLASLVITLEVSLPEFLEIQRATDSERRARFDLAASCDPVITGHRGRGTKFAVVVYCASESPSGDDLHPG
jgi:hypothetical protein